MTAIGGTRGRARTQGYLLASAAGVATGCALDSERGDQLAKYVGFIVIFGAGIFAILQIGSHLPPGPIEPERDFLMLDERTKKGRAARTRSSPETRADRLKRIHFAANGSTSRPDAQS
jgi:hypothetical protein